MNQKSFIILAIIAISSLLLFSSYRKQQQQGQSLLDTKLNTSNVEPYVIGSHKIQLVFALDATGSMSGLLNAAKEKIWGITSSMTQSEQAPDIEVGLLFYRDIGDEFVTKMVPLSQNLDDVYAELMKIDAGGGGDSPESVNQALHETIQNFAWDKDQEKTYKTIFLVGDCPPHLDYKSDVNYLISCKKAKEKDIYLNTILMGDDHEAKRIWKQIANFNQGSFTQVNMNANDIAISTPYDDSISILSDQIDEMRYYYGNDEEKSFAKDKKTKSKSISTSINSNAKVQRAEYNNTKTGKSSYIGKKEILNDLKENKINLANIKEDELPDEFKNMPANERKAILEQKMAKKELIQNNLNDLIKKRSGYVKKELDKKGTAVVDSSFSNVIYEKVKTQSSKKNIKLEGKAKY